MSDGSASSAASGVAVECEVGGDLVGGNAAMLKPAGGKQRRKRPLRGPPPAAVASQMPIEKLLPLQEGVTASLVRVWTVLDAAFASASMRAMCPSGHPIATAAACCGRGRSCAMCGGRLDGPFVA